MKLLGKFILSALVALCVLVTSCKNYDEDIANMKTEVEAMKTTLASLQNAYNEGKIITSVTPIEGVNDWQITFSDNTSITITSGKDGVDGQKGSDGATPYVKVDDNNCWAVSYDNGKTYTTLLDTNGNPIVAKGDKGDTGEAGAQGPQGVAGKDGNSVRVVVGEDLYYVIEVYNPTTGNVVDRIVSPYSSNPQNAIKSIVEDKATHTITITMESGDVFAFKQMVVFPTSIIVLDTKLALKHGGVDTISFRVNPSNAEFDVKNIHLDLVGFNRSKAEVSYITPPTEYSIKAVEQAQDELGNVKRGQYHIIVQDNETNPDYNHNVAVVLAMTDAQGKPMEISSQIILATSVYPSALPRVYVTTPNGVEITSKTEWYKKSHIRIVDENGHEDLNASTSIRGRGNTTWEYPKKPYAIKLDAKAEVLGMPKHKRWVLLANWMDRTLLRNDVSFEMARRVMEWAPRGEFVELYVNGKHYGNYYLCEHIKVDKNRVNVDELDEGTDFEDESQISGGYILEYDTYGPNDEINYFYSQYKNLPVTIKEPDEEVITSWQHPAFLYISGYVNSLEKALNDKEPWEVIESLIDVNSYIDWWVVHELAYNREPFWPKSSYMYKKRDGKLLAGPVWDFDFGTYRPGYDEIALKETLYYADLFTYSEFKTAVKARWAETKSSYADMDQYIEQQADLIAVSNEVNIEKWPIFLNANEDENLKFQESIDRMINGFQDRFEAVDAFISTL